MSQVAQHSVPQPTVPLPQPPNPLQQTSSLPQTTPSLPQVPLPHMPLPQPPASYLPQHTPYMPQPPVHQPLNSSDQAPPPQPPPGLQTGYDDVPLEGITVVVPLKGKVNIISIWNPSVLGAVKSYETKLLP